MLFEDFSLQDLLQALERRLISAREVVQGSIDAIETLNPSVNAFVSLDFESALRSAARFDDDRANHRYVPKLGGIPFGVKDLEDAIGHRTTRGSRLFAEAPVATQDSLMVSRLRALGAIPIGKTNTPEFGWKGDTTNLVFGATTNPLDRTKSPGGSSGGSAAAIASGMVPFATGSDGGGSLRIPSALCGLPAFKVSLGQLPVVSTPGPTWGDLSVGGPMARTFGDIALLLDELVIPDVRDYRSRPAPDGFFSQYAAKASRPKRLLASVTLGYAPVDKAVRGAFEAALETIEAQGIAVVRREDIFDDDPVGHWVVMTSAYTASMLAAYGGERIYHQLDPDLVESLRRFGPLSAVDFVGASEACYALNVRFASMMEGFDGLLTPTVSTLAPRSGGLGEVDGQESENWVRFTYPFNMTRSPAAAIPLRSSGGGLPLSLQLAGVCGADLEIMSIAAYLEDLLQTEASSS